MMNHIRQLTWMKPHAVLKWVLILLLILQEIKKQILKSSGREHYKVSIILSIAGNGYKLPPLVIVKGESGKSAENESRRPHNHKKDLIYIYCQTEAWCNTFIFKEWILKVFKNYEKEIGAKCLLILEKTPSHSSNESIAFFNENNVTYAFIPSGMTPVCQTLDIGINRVFKDNIKILFEKSRLFFDDLNPKIKLKKLG